MTSTPRGRTRTPDSSADAVRAGPTWEAGSRGLVQLRSPGRRLVCRTASPDASLSRQACALEPQLWDMDSTPGGTGGAGPHLQLPQTGIRGGSWWSQAGDLGPAGPPCGPSQPPRIQPTAGNGTPAAKSPTTRRLEGAHSRDEGTSAPRKDRKRGWRPGGKHQASG